MSIYLYIYEKDIMKSLEHWLGHFIIVENLSLGNNMEDHLAMEFEAISRYTTNESHLLDGYKMDHSQGIHFHFVHATQVTDRRRQKNNFDLCKWELV